MPIDNDLKEFLDKKVEEYNKMDFIESDPISIPHSFSLKEDIEISAFLTAIISWGNRKSIINNAKKMMMLLDNSPFDFVINHSEKDLKALGPFVHRTFNKDDLLTFITCLRNLYVNETGLEGSFNRGNGLIDSLSAFPDTFFFCEVPQRTKKHIAKIDKKSAAKRINMFLRWMVRKDENGVDFGLWNSINPSSLHIPLDIHTGNVSRKLSLLKRKQNDWNSVLELTNSLRSFDSKDPIKYDYALFGLGVFEGFN